MPNRGRTSHAFLSLCLSFCQFENKSTRPEKEHSERLAPRHEKEKKKSEHNNCWAARSSSNSSATTRSKKRQALQNRGTMGDMNYSLTTFNKSGKLLQIEYALNRVAQGKMALGIKATNGVVIAADKKVASVLVDADDYQKIQNITPSTGFVYAGMVRVGINNDVGEGFGISHVVCDLWCLLYFVWWWLELIAFGGSGFSFLSSSAIRAISGSSAVRIPLCWLSLNGSE